MQTLFCLAILGHRKKYKKEKTRMQFFLSFARKQETKLTRFILIVKTETLIFFQSANTDIIFLPLVINRITTFYHKKLMTHEWIPIIYHTTVTLNNCSENDKKIIIGSVKAKADEP